MSHGDEFFVGRDAELRRLHELFASAAAGRARLALIAGEPGIGKTTLARRFATGLADHACVAWARAFSQETTPPFWPFVTLLRRLRATTPEALDPRVATLLPELGGTESTTAPTSAAASRFALFDGVAQTLGRASADRPLLIVLDDLHAADVGSVELLRFIIRELEQSPLLVVATVRSVDRRAPSDMDEALAGLAREAQTLPLAGLARDEVSRWLAQTAAADEAGDDVWHLSRGNPLFLSGLVRRLAGSTGDRTHLPDALNGLVLDRIAPLAPEARRTLEVLAVGRRPMTATLVATALGSSLDATLAALDTGRMAGLVLTSEPTGAYWELTHPLFGDLVADAMSPAARAATHARVGRALEGQYAIDATHRAALAHHLLAASPYEPTLDDGLRYAATALHDLRGAAAFEDGARLAQEALLALDRLPRPEDIGLRLDLTLALAELALHGGQRDKARHAASAAADLATRREEYAALARSALTYARAVEYAVPDATKLALLEQALSLQPDPRSEDAIRLRATLALELWTVSDSEQRRDLLSADALRAARARPAPGLLELALAARIQARWSPDAIDERRALTEELSAMSLSSPNLEVRLEGHRARLNLLVELGDRPGARREADAYARLAEALRRPQLRYNATIRQLLFPTWTGDWAAALELNERARVLGLRAGDPQVASIHAAVRLLIGVEGSEPRARVDLADLHDALETVRREADHVPDLVLYRAILIRGLVHLGRLDESRDHWRRVFSEELAAAPRHLMSLATWSLLAMSASALATPEEARRLVALLSPFAHLHAAIGATFSLGAAARYVGLAARAAGQLEAARDALTQALWHQRAMGAVAWLAATEQDLRELPGRTEPPPPTAVAAPAPVTRRAALIRRGDLWLVRVDGVENYVRHQLGLTLLTHLLARPGQEVSALELGGGAEGLGSRAGSELGLDARAIATYRERVTDLRERIDEAESHHDAERAERLGAELAALAHELTRGGLGGRGRPVADAIERARVRVTKALQRAIAAIAAVSPALGQHLARAVRTGTAPSYVPPLGDAHTWELTADVTPASPTT